MMPLNEFIGYLILMFVCYCFIFRQVLSKVDPEVKKTAGRFVMFKALALLNKWLR